MNRTTPLLISLLIVIIFSAAPAQTPSVVMELSGTKVLKGFMQRNHLEHDSLFSWFKPNYDSYHIDSAAVKQIAPLAKDVRFVTVVGTWCGDSKREVPRMFKVLDAAGVAPDSVVLFGVDRTKKSDDGTTDQYNIMRVPTIIIIRDGMELGRIVEQPRNTLEQDFLRLLTR